MNGPSTAVAFAVPASGLGEVAAALVTGSGLVELTTSVEPPALAKDMAKGGA
jgi:hypothetical protein